MLIDAHAHLADASFEPDLDEVLARARAAGVARIVVVGEHRRDAPRVLELAAQHPDLIAPAIGLHPEHADLDEAAALARLIRENADALVAIGEVGLDYWKAKEPEQRAVQREVLAGAVQLSRELDLPLNVRPRSAGRHVIALLLEHGATRVLMHAFDGRHSRALPGIEAGFYFSMPPSLVRSEQKQKLVRHLPLERLILETDSPVLGPDKTQRNEPANLVLARKAVAELKGVSEEEVEEVTGRNARNLFGL